MLLRQMLYRCEIRFLPVIAGFWLRSGPGTDYEELIRLICDRMLDPSVLKKMLNGSEGTALSQGLQYLNEHGGEETAERFEDRFGPLRYDGIDKICREKRWKTPVSATEKLWYRGLIFRENRFAVGELKDCYILPEDLRALLTDILPETENTPEFRSDPLIVRPAAPSETQRVDPADNKLPEFFTLSAALKRDNRPVEIPGLQVTPQYTRFIDVLLQESGMFPANSEADSECIRKFLTSNKTAARLSLMRIWRNSPYYDEIEENTEQIRVIEPPLFDKRVPRQHILNMILELQEDTWWSLNGFIAAVKRRDARFLRSSFSSDHWQILDMHENDLSGMGSWFQLEGSWIRFLIFGPLYWLGIVQTAYSDGEPSAFRITRDGRFILTESSEAETPAAILSKPNLEQAIPSAAADGAIICSNDVPRYFRYMCARCCEIEKYDGKTCIFRLTPGSLAAAEKNGISRQTFLKILRRFSGKAIPPSLENMLSAPGKSIIPATIYTGTILTVPEPEILTDILESPRLEKWLLQKLNPNSILIDPKGINEIRRFLMEKEIFVEIQ